VFLLLSSSKHAANRNRVRDDGSHAWTPTLNLISFNSGQFDGCDQARNHAMVPLDLSGDPVAESRARKQALFRYCVSAV
jgi:hypothetical protein